MSGHDPHFKSPYEIGKLNEPIELAHEAFAYVSDKAWAYGTGTVGLRFLPRPSLDFVARFPVTSFAHAVAREEQLGLPDRGRVVPGFSTSQSTYLGSPKSSRTLVWKASPQYVVAIGDDQTLVDHVVFHLINFVDFESQNASIEQVETKVHRINHLKLEWGNFVIRIRSLPSTYDTEKALRDHGGFAITHLGRVSEKNGVMISVNDVEQLLFGLNRFFSLARGAWSPPVLPVGFDKAGNRVWECWNSPPGDTYTWTHAWFDSMHGNHLESCFPGFMSLWSDPKWKDAVDEAIYWYLNSNYSPRGIDAGIILTQTAIERLCYTHSVENGKFVSLDGFNKLSAADRIRLLCATLNIPQSIPASMKEITALGKEQNWQDAPQALTEIRNEKVHPQHKKRGQFEAATYEAWTLGLWYVELILLRLSGYDGQYANRLHSLRDLGEVENVPWAP